MVTASQHTQEELVQGRHTVRHHWKGRDEESVTCLIRKHSIGATCGRSTSVEFKTGDLNMYRKSEGQGASLDLTTKCCGICIRDSNGSGNWKSTKCERLRDSGSHGVGRSSLRACSRQQQGFAEISGRRRARSKAGADDHDPELEQPLVRLQSCCNHEDNAITEAGTEAVRTTSIEDRGSSHQPEAEPAALLDDARMRRNLGRTPDPRVRFVGHLAGPSGRASKIKESNSGRSGSKFWT